MVQSEVNELGEYSELGLEDRVPELWLPPFEGFAGGAVSAAPAVPSRAASMRSGDSPRHLSALSISDGGASAPAAVGVAAAPLSRGLRQVLPLPRPNRCPPPPCRIPRQGQMMLDAAGLPGRSGPTARAGTAVQPGSAAVWACQPDGSGRSAGSAPTWMHWGAARSGAWRRAWTTCRRSVPLPGPPSLRSLTAPAAACAQAMAASVLHEAVAGEPRAAAWRQQVAQHDWHSGSGGAVIACGRRRRQRPAAAQSTGGSLLYQTPARSPGLHPWRVAGEQGGERAPRWGRARRQVRASPVAAGGGATHWSEPLPLDGLGAAAVVTLPAPLQGLAGLANAPHAAVILTVTARQVKAPKTYQTNRACYEQLVLVTTWPQLMQGTEW